MKNKFLLKNKLAIIILIVILVLTFPFYINSKIKFDEIKNKGKLSIGKFTRYERLPKSRNFYFKYLKNKNIYEDFIRKAPDGFSKNIGKFYEIKYLDKYDDIIVNFDKEITDTTLILKAGFSKEDIANMPK